MNHLGNSFDRQVNLLGILRIRDAEGELALSGEKPQSLLGFLLMNPNLPHSRERLAEMLFPEASYDRVRRNFSDTLYRVQKSLGSDWLTVDSDTVALRADERLWVDVWEFDRLVRSAAPSDLRKAVELYTGDLLPACYDDWIFQERELRRSQNLIALENLSAFDEGEGNLHQALLTTRRLILAEPLHEPAHQIYLRLLGRLQRYAEALAHYDYLRQILKDELNAEPLSETQQLMNTLERERAMAAVPLEIVDQSPFIGRAAERTVLLEAVEKALSGHGGIFAIEGEPGIGKSRLLREISSSARWRGTAVLPGTASETPQNSPFAPLIDALSSFLVGSRMTQLKSLLPQDIFSILAPLLPSNIGSVSPSILSQEQVNRHFNQALRTFGLRLAQLSPLMLILDDVQWATPVLWETIDSFSQGLIEGRGLLILAYRRNEMEQSIGWDKLQAWEKNRGLKILSLKPLTFEETVQFVAHHPQVEPVVIHAMTGGIPFFIEEWIKGMGNNQSAHGYTLSSRMADISPASRIALAYASVLGESFLYPVWARMMEMQPLDLAALSDELVINHWLIPSADGYTFAHDLIRKAIYAELDAERVQEYHQRAARAFQSLEPENFRSIAFHLDLGGLLGEATEAYRQAGQQAFNWCAFREAQTLFERAIALMPPRPSKERIETMIQLADTCQITGDREVQHRAMEESLAGALSLKSDRLLLEAKLIHGRAASTMNRFSEAENSLKEALSLAKRLKDSTKQGKIFTILGINANRQFQSGMAQSYYKRALRLARKWNDPTLEAVALSGLGLTSVEQSQPGEGVKWLNQALVIQRAQGDYQGETRTLMYLASAYYHLGAWDQHITIAEEGLSRYQKMGNRHTTAFLSLIRGLAFYSLGNTNHARPLLEQAEQDYRKVGDNQAAGMARNILGLIAESEGRDEDALQFYREALAIAEKIEAINETALAHIDLGALLLKLDQPAQAIPHLEVGNKISNDHQFKILSAKSGSLLGLAYLAVGDPRSDEMAEKGWRTFQEGIPLGEQPQGWLWALYRLLDTLGRRTEAIEVLEAAYRELQRQAEAIRDHEMRRNFFQQVPLNRDIVAAFDHNAGIARNVFVSLAQVNAPLGRPLREEEMVGVKWTVNAPEDEAISNKNEKRHYRLKRLLAEAEQQGGAPTDEDLARALDVSRRTILRDMQILSEMKTLPATRKRKIGG